MRAKPEIARVTDIVPVRVESLCRWVVQYTEAAAPDLKSRLSTALGAATVLLRTNLETGEMAEPSKEEKDLAFYLLAQSRDRGYNRNETVAAIIGAADAFALRAVAVPP